MLFESVSLLRYSPRDGNRTPSPKADSMMRICFTNSENSSGNRLALWSGPGNVLSVVRCRSMTFAPMATAAQGTDIPASCPEYPIVSLNRSFRTLRKLRFTSWCGAGYVLLQWRRIYSAFFFLRKSTSCSISETNDMPVEISMGFFRAAIFPSNGRLNMSGDPILNAGTFNDSNNLRLFSSQGEQRNSMPRERAYRHTSRICESLSSVFTMCFSV